MDAIDDYLEALLDDTPVVKTEPAARHAAAGDGTVVPLVAPSPSPPHAATPPVSTIATVDAGETAPMPNMPMQTAPALPTNATIAQIQAPRWVRVTVAADSYALELLCVQEVVRVMPIVAMRGADRAVLGVMNLRGRIVPVFDLGLWLGLACVQPDDRSRIVVVERDDELIGVLVSTVEDVVTLGRDRIEPPLPGSDPGAILGIARVGATPTVLLDANSLYG
jgi:purine-binding chemotaxis protein CheW